MAPGELCSNYKIFGFRACVAVHQTVADGTAGKVGTNGGGGRPHTGHRLVEVSQVASVSARRMTHERSAERSASPRGGRISFPGFYIHIYCTFVSIIHIPLEYEQYTSIKNINMHIIQASVMYSYITR